MQKSHSNVNYCHNESPAAARHSHFPKEEFDPPSEGLSDSSKAPLPSVTQSCCIPATTATYSRKQKRSIQPAGISKLCHAQPWLTLQEQNLLSAGHLEPKGEFPRDCRLPGNICSYQPGVEYKSMCTPSA